MSVPCAWCDGLADHNLGDHFAWCDGCSERRARFLRLINGTLLPDDVERPLVEGVIGNTKIRANDHKTLAAWVKTVAPKKEKATPRRKSRNHPAEAEVSTMHDTIAAARRKQKEARK